MAWLFVKSIGRVAVAVAVAVILVAATQRFGTYLTDAVAHWTWPPTWLSGIASWLGQEPPPGLNYQAIVTAALAVTGTLAGVYFATVAFVVSTTYKDATSRVRDLVTRLPGGKLYAYVYVQAVLFGLVILALPLAESQPNRLSLCVVTILGAFVLLSFGRLRTQLYGLLEPVGLLPMVQRDLTRWTTQASRLTGRDPTGLRTRLCRARTTQSLLVLRDLCHLIRERERTVANVTAEYAGTDPRTQTAARFTLAIWLQYAKRKGTLIELPGWCSQRIRHKDWLLTDHHEVGIALATATTLQATTVADALWVERHLAQVLSELIGGRELPQLASILGEIDDPTRWLMSRGFFGESRLWFETVVAPARVATTQQSANTNADEASETNSGEDSVVSTTASDGHLYNLVDFVALAYTQAVLGLYDYTHALTVDFPNWIVTQAYDHNVRNLGPVPAELLRNLRDGLRFEETVEGHRVTSVANINQLLARAIATESIDEAVSLMDTFEREFWPWARDVSSGRTLAAGAALSRLDEALHKWASPLSSLSTLFEQCEAVHRDVDDQWPNLSLDRLTARRAALQEKLRAPIARVATRVETDMDRDRPDVFGWAFYRAHQDLLEDVLEDQVPIRASLEPCLRGLVIATERARARLLSTVQRLHQHVLGSLWSEPVLMLLQLSGAALVAGLARQRSDLLDVFERVWRELLDKDPQKILDAAISALYMDHALFGLSAGKINRSNRHQQVMESLNQFGISYDDIAYGNLEESHPNLDTKLATMFKWIGHCEFEDVFVAAWLVPEGRDRGAVLRSDILTPRLSEMIDEFSKIIEGEANTQDGPGVQEDEADNC